MPPITIGQLPGLDFSTTIGNFMVSDEIVSYTREFVSRSKSFDQLIGSKKLSKPDDDLFDEYRARQER